MTHSGNALLPIAAVQNDGGPILPVVSPGRRGSDYRVVPSGFEELLRFAWLSKFFEVSAAIEHR